ncbi:MAG: Fe-S cluster assembly protein SufD [Chloroflexota bacterium]|nr:Fe-S cluster assembly protein SufD [Chloroflexota bacterium]
MSDEKLQRFFNALNGALAENHRGNGWLGGLRAQASQTFQQIPIPSYKEKSWSQLAAMEFGGQLSASQLPQVTTGSLEGETGLIGARVTVCSDSMDFQLSAAAAQQGLVLCSLEKASEHYGDLLSTSLSLAELGGTDKVAAFNLAASRHGFLLYVPKNVQLQSAVEILIESGPEQAVFPSSGWIVLDEDAQASVVVRQKSAAKQQPATLTSLALAVDLRANADLHLLETQQLANGSWNFINEASRLGAGASLNQFVLDLGSSVNKRVLGVDLQGDGSQASITGVYTPQADQVYVYDTHQNHNASHTTSDLLFSGVLDDSAYSLWKGNVYVAEGTKGADGFQINRNLLLDEASHAESIPGLEIIADDVRCSHAVTLSNVDPEQLFFLESRGIGPDEAEKLIVSGFLEATSNRMNQNNLKELIKEVLK